MDEQSAAFGPKLLSEGDYSPDVFLGSAFFRYDIGDLPAEPTHGILVTLRQWIIPVTN